MAKMPEVAVTAINGFLCDWYRNIVFLCVLNSIFPAGYIPLPPRCDHLQFGVQRKECQLKPHLQKLAITITTNLTGTKCHIKISLGIISQSIRT